MTKTLHAKLSLVLLGLLCFSGLLSLALALSTAQKYFQEVNQKVNRGLAADLTSHLAARGLLRPAEQGRARAEIKELMAINPSVEVYLLDARGGHPDVLRRPRDGQAGAGLARPPPLLPERGRPAPDPGGRPARLPPEEGLLRRHFFVRGADRIRLCDPGRRGL